jgi:hypothetical protein
METDQVWGDSHSYTDLARPAVACCDNAWRIATIRKEPRVHTGPRERWHAFTNARQVNWFTATSRRTGYRRGRAVLRDSPGGLNGRSCQSSFACVRHRDQCRRPQAHCYFLLRRAAAFRSVHDLWDRLKPGLFLTRAGGARRIFEEHGSSAIFRAFRPRQRETVPPGCFDGRNVTTTRSPGAPGPPFATNFQSLWHILANMRIRSGRSRNAVTSKPRKRDDLLAIWLDLLKQFDHAPRRRAAKLRQAQPARRPIQAQRSASGPPGKPPSDNHPTSRIAAL